MMLSIFSGSAMMEKMVCDGVCDGDGAAAGADADGEEEGEEGEGEPKGTIHTLPPTDSAARTTERADGGKSSNARDGRAEQRAEQQREFSLSLSMEQQRWQRWRPLAEDVKVTRPARGGEGEGGVSEVSPATLAPRL